MLKQSVFLKYVLPFIRWYVLMILVTIAIDYIFHRFHLVFIGRYLGLSGTILVIISFIYSLRKRRIIQSGSPKKLLLFHEYLAWAGSVMLLVHAGIHFNAILPWLAVLMLLINVASGLVGKFLLIKARETLKGKRAILLESGTPEEETEKILFWDSVTVDIMNKWRVVHLPIAMLFAILALLHIITILIFS
jgi:hypothetical protein